jgi:hypothetical protein
MKHTIQFLLLAGLLLAAPVGQLSARTAPDMALAEESLGTATAQQVLDAAAPLVGESSASLYTQYTAGVVSITDLGPIRGGHRYQVSKAGVYDFVIDIVVNT